MSALPIATMPGHGWHSSKKCNMLRVFQPFLETEDLPPPLPDPKVSKSLSQTCSFDTIFGKYFLRPWDRGVVGVDPQFQPFRVKRHMGHYQWSSTATAQRIRQTTVAMGLITIENTIC
eukprot:6111879-Amphidinium_carterae.1